MSKKVQQKPLDAMTKEELRDVILALCEKYDIPPLLPSGEPFKILEAYDRRTGRVVYSIYATRVLASYLAKKYNLVVEMDPTILMRMSIPKEVMDRCVVVGAVVKDAEGRSWPDIGCAPLPPCPKSEDPKEMARYMVELGNAVKTAWTQAWRRAVLNLVGLGGLDESETAALQSPSGTTGANNVEDHHGRVAEYLEKVYKTIERAVEANQEIFTETLEEFGVENFNDLPPDAALPFVRSFTSKVRAKSKTSGGNR